MRLNAIVAGVGLTKFGKHLERSQKWLAGEAARMAIADAGLQVADIVTKGR